MHYSTLHCNSFHNTTLHYTTLQCITQYCTSVHTQCPTAGRYLGALEEYVLPLLLVTELDALVRDGNLENGWMEGNLESGRMDGNLESGWNLFCDFSTHKKLTKRFIEQS